jgi:hypothetical protein
VCTDYKELSSRHYDNTTLAFISIWQWLKRKINGQML